MSPRALGCHLLALLLAGSGCATSGKPVGATAGSDSIPLIVTSSGPDTLLPEIQLLVDGHTKLFLLDTGAASSSISVDVHTKSYPSLGAAESKGVSGNATACDMIQFEKMVLGNHAFRKRTIKRCDRNILGLDLLSELTFEVDLQGEQLNILRQFPQDSPIQPIRRLTPGHLTIPVVLDTQAVDALFDTGADITVIDTHHIEQHPQSFEVIRTEEGNDAHGNKIQSKVYRCRSIMAGPLQLTNVEIAAFDFGDHLREKMEGSPVILGNNVISKARWRFDIAAGKWNAKAY